MKNLLQMQQRHAQLVKDGRELLDKAAEEKRDLSADELEKHNKISAELAAVAGNMDAEMRQVAAESRKPVEVTDREDRDLGQFNIGRIVRHLYAVHKGQPSTLDGIEAEMVQEGAKENRESGVGADGLCLPRLLVQGFQTRRMALNAEQRATLSVTGGTTGQYGGELVAESKGRILGDFYNAAKLEQAGAMVLTGLVNNLSLPNYVQGSNPAKKTENEASTDVGGTFTALDLTPNRLSGYAVISDQLMMQSDENIALVLSQDISADIAAVKEKAFFHGGGTNEPTGIAGTAGIGSVAGGTNGAAPDWDDIVDLESAIAVDDVSLDNLVYFSNSAVRGKLKKTPLVASTDSQMVWDRQSPNAPLNGYRTEITNAIRSDLDKGSSTGVCSAIFAVVPQYFYVGYWGGVMLEVVRDSTDAKAGQRHLVANTYYDAGLRKAQAAAAMLDALTA